MPSDVQIRDLTSAEDLRAIEQLQRIVWGMSDLDILPATMLVAAIEVGAVLVGAFVEDYLAGFAFAFPGLDHGQLTLHSDMLGIDPAYRNLDLGYRLKLAQRDRALSNDITQITWTFDPLQSLNAYFNLAKLGVVSDTYKIDFYGETSSFLHQLGTDRLWVRWQLQSERVISRLEKSVVREDIAALADKYDFLVKAKDDLSPETKTSGKLENQHLLIEIPADINVIIRDDLSLALSWRDAVRWAFTGALAAGYIVDDFFRLDRRTQSSGIYLLSK